MQTATIKTLPLVSVVIVNYNDEKHLQHCLTSVLKSEYPFFEVILVDNGSTDGSVELVKKLFKNNLRIKLIQNERNVGPAAGRNIGVEAAKGRYLAFLDNDTEVDPNWLKEAIKVMESDLTIGAAQCKLLLMGRRDRFDYAGDYLSPYGFLIQRVEMGAVDKGQLDYVSEIFTAKSAAAIVQRKVLNEIGLFDEDYFIYVEETDLCWRIWIRGYKVVFVPKSVVYHAFGSSGKIDPQHAKYNSMYHASKNYIATLAKNLSNRNLIKMLLPHLSFWTAISIWLILKRDLYSASYILKGIFWNLTNFRHTWKKHETVQHSIRRVSDKDIMPKIMRRKDLEYFHHKLKAAHKYLSDPKD